MFGERLGRWEKVLYIIILIAAVCSRFYMLGDRAISHDESIHTKFSWNLYNGQGFQHNPMMHGPLLFEATAFFYHLFGPNDFTSRIFVALAGIVLVMTPVLFRRWIGRSSALATSALLLISPSISYYSRYIRHDIPLLLTAVLLLWIVLEYLDGGKRGDKRWLTWLAATFSVMHATKEASYIYIAIFGALFFLPFAWQVLTTKWQRENLVIVFIAALVLVLVLGLVFVYGYTGAQVDEQSLDEAGNTRIATVALPVWARLSAGFAFLTLLAAVVVGYYGVGEEKMRHIRMFDVLMVIGTLTLPLGSAFLIKYVAGLDMNVVYDAVISGNLTTMMGPTVTGLASIILLTLLSSAILGLWWDAKRWPVVALIHYAIFFVLYTTFFRWGYGALSGLVGGLSYWLAQQGVKRGGQPFYYYFLIGPMYEYLALCFSAIGGVGALVHFARTPHASGKRDGLPAKLNLSRLLPLFLLGWTVASWVAYTYAGEKMPWLLVHITLPSVFLAGWAVGKLIDGLDWRAFVARRGWLLVPVLPLAVIALVVFGRSTAEFVSAMREGVSTAGPSLAQLTPFGTLIGGLIASVAFGGAFVWLARKFRIGWLLRFVGLAVAVVLALLTVRTSVQLNFVNYDLATELMVYAHSTPDIKIALGQIEDISWQTTGSAHDVNVAYGEDGSWPFTWYMVDYPNNYFYGTSPDAERLLECPVVIAGSPQYSAVEEVLGADYLYFDYKYLWWPIQDYYDLTPDRIRGALSDPAMRGALWDILWKRDYTRYAALKNPESPFDLQKWPYRKQFRLYVRRDLAQAAWSYKLGEMGVQAVRPAPTRAPDPYAAGMRSLSLVSGATLAGAGVRDLAVAADGTLYVTDTVNHRVWHVTPQGDVLGQWGEFGTAAGQFNEPWGIAVADDGSVFVADTWNHRVQKFTADGQFLGSWGALAQVDLGDPVGQSVFYGPRGLAVGPDGNIYVTDTGNKRVVVFGADGTFVREFGGSGAAPGQMNEPVGIAVDEAGQVYVADTWNQRVQVFSREGVFLRQWDVPAWQGDSPEEKPFLALGDGALDGASVYVSDPVNQRVLAFTLDGAFAWALGNVDAGLHLTFPEGLAVVDDVLYVADTYSSQVLGYGVP